MKIQWIELIRQKERILMSELLKYSEKNGYKDCLYQQ